MAAGEGGFGQFLSVPKGGLLAKKGFSVQKGVQHRNCGAPFVLNSPGLGEGGERGVGVREARDEGRERG